MPNPTDEELYQGLQITDLIPSLTIPLVGSATWDNRPNVIRRADAYDAAAAPWAAQQHVPQAITAVEASVDDTNADVVTRWAEGNITAAEIGRWRESGGACPCNACVQDAYATVQRSVGSTPLGYRNACRCVACIRWRRAMVEGIQGVLLGERAPVRSYSVSLSDVLRNAEVSELEMLTAAQPAPRILTRREREEREASMTPFERDRSRRGHPVPKMALAADWKPNQWEA